MGTQEDDPAPTAPGAKASAPPTKAEATRARLAATQGRPPAKRRAKGDAPKTERLPKDLVLLQLAMVLLSGGKLTYKRLTEEFLLRRRTAERYLADLKDAGIPVESRRVGREAVFALAEGRSKTLAVEAIDIPPAAARSLSLLLVAAALLPENLGVRQAVDATVRAALRLRGMKAATELRRLEDAVVVLENDAKDYAGRTDVFGTLIDATLAGLKLTVRYHSPRVGRAVRETFFPATIGLYKGGLYVLAIDEDDDGSTPRWRAVERIVEPPYVHEDEKPLEAGHRLRALDEARSRWGPARPRPDLGDGAGIQIITLHFSERAAPYVLARPWHQRAELEPWPADQGGGVRMAIRLSGDTSMFESWVRSWGNEVQVLRPSDMANRIAESLEQAAAMHRAGPARWTAETE